MFGIGEGELVLIVLFAFLVFGPDKLPGMGRTLGRALRQFKNAQEGFTEVVQTNIVDPAAEALSDSPKKPNRNRAAELDEDADIDVPEGEKPERTHRTETFAERKKRLAEEKAARDAAEAAAAAEADADKDDDAVSSGTDVAEDASAQPAPASANDPQPAPKPTLTDLYAMGRSSRPANRAAGAGVSLDATHEVSEERSDERGAGEGDPGSGGAAASNEKEA